MALRDLLYNDASVAARRQKYITLPHISGLPTVERPKAVDRFAMVRAWLDKRIASRPDLVIFDGLVDSIPATLAEGHSRYRLANIAQHVLKRAGYKNLGQFQNIPGRHRKGAYLWAAKFIDRGNLPPLTIERVERYVPPDRRNSEPGLQWLRDHAPTLPALAYAPDIAALIPETIGGYPGQRVKCASRYLAERGAVFLGEHVTDHGRRKLWATRDIDRLQRMTARERVRECFGRVPYRRHQ